MTQFGKHSEAASSIANLLLLNLILIRECQRARVFGQPNDYGDKGREI